nr:hypothetical protein [Tanacetum cinerariifolium]
MMVGERLLTIKGIEGMRKVMEKNRVPRPTNANDYDRSGKGKSKVDEGRSSRDSFAENRMASEKMNIDERVINKKKYGGVENVNIGMRIYEGEDDEVCEKGLRITIKEKSNCHSSKMIPKESKTKTKAMVKFVMIDKGLAENQATRKVYEEVYSDEQDKIKEMIMKKKLAERGVTRQVLSIAEIETWSEEKLGFYKNYIGAEAYDNMVSQIRIGNSEDINDKARLLKNLIDHMSIVGNKPWVLLGDFNVILRSNENSNRLSIKSEDTQYFRACIDCLGMEDINMSGLFDTWIQEIKNLDLGVLKKLDKIMAKRLKFMKKYTRDLNRKNGDVFDKVKFLRTKLGRVQGCLEKDPSNTYLREEEMIYAYAFKEAALDEEKLLQQKTKIAWLKDGYFNSSYFHKKSRMLFSSIDDNKASRPDGYSSKFLKAAWNVVGQDLCFAVKEFFTKGKLLIKINTTLISLIPKVKSLARVTDYRPISCCNVVYKVISKVIINRLKLVLNGLVDVNQSTFIRGRQCSDNILLAQEFMRNYCWGYMAKNCAFKVDIQKACESEIP